MITSTELDYFIEIAKAGHMSRAADRLGVTQPSLSHCVKKMENVLGTDLLIRSKKGVELTEAGKRLYGEAESLQQHWKRVMSSVQDEVEKPQGLIRFGCHTAVAQYSLPEFMPNLVRNYPDIKIELLHGLSRHVTEDVISSKIDVALAVNPVRHNDLVIKEICKDIVAIWRPANCANPNLLMFAPELIQTQKILSDLGKKGIQFTNRLESSSLEVITGLLSSGVGSAILPERVVKSMISNKKIKRLKNSPSFSDRICLVYRPEFRKTKRGQVFVDLLISSMK